MYCKPESVRSPKRGCLMGCLIFDLPSSMRCGTAYRPAEVVASLVANLRGARGDERVTLPLFKTAERVCAHAAVLRAAEAADAGPKNERTSATAPVPAQVGGGDVMGGVMELLRLTKSLPI